ncbi:MAG: hypothetical protein CMK32_10085 [Porticoccaceae bacterium]|nr:hypothetical protein [Porticoccaceae bacterium]
MAYGGNSSAAGYGYSTAGNKSIGDAARKYMSKQTPAQSRYQSSQYDYSGVLGQNSPINRDPNSAARARSLPGSQYSAAAESAYQSSQPQISSGVPNSQYGEAARQLAQQQQALQRDQQALNSFRADANDIHQQSLSSAAARRASNPALQTYQNIQDSMQKSGQAAMGDYAGQTNALANSMASRGAAAEAYGNARYQAAQNPVTYKGVTVNPAAIAANKTMSPGRAAMLAANGYEVSPEGVVQQQGPKKIVGQNIGGTAAEVAQQIYGGTGADLAAEARRIGQARYRYGIPEDGGGSTPQTREDLINARNDLTMQEKQDYISKSQQRDNPYSPERMARMERYNNRQQQKATAGQIAQQQARNAQLGQLAQAAAMGSAPAAEALGQIARSQAYAQQGMMQNQLGYAQIASDQAARQAEQQWREKQSERQNRLDMANAAIQQAEVERARARDARESKIADAKLAQAEFELDQAKREAGNQAPGFNDLVNQALTQYPEATPADARQMAMVAQGTDSINRAVEAGDRGAALLSTVPASAEYGQAMEPMAAVDDYLSRVSQSIGLGNEGIGSVSPEMLMNGFSENGLSAADARKFAEKQLKGIGANNTMNASPGVPTIEELHSVGQVTDDTFDRIQRLNAARKAIGMPLLTLSGKALPKEMGRAKTYESGYASVPGPVGAISEFAMTLQDLLEGNK